MLRKDSLRDVISSLPDSPGVYQFFDVKDELIYIGKAKSLKKRVSSYFNRKNYDNAKLKILVKKIYRIEHILVETESDALLLENNLIKKYQPKYNINLKDDKTFPWICVKNESFPRVFSTRSVIKDGSKYYGPYTSAQTVRTLLSLVKELYKLRTCKYDLSPENISKGKFKVCLEYHLKNCLGPCEGLQSQSDYGKTIEQVNNILKGNLNDVIGYMKNIMLEYSKDFMFEEAESVKQKIESIKKFQMKSTIVNTGIHNVDVFSIKEEGMKAYVNFLKINNGSIIQAHTIEISKKLVESKEELLGFAVIDIRERLNSQSKEIILPFFIPDLPDHLKQTIPKIGDKKKLLELSERNAKYFALERKKNIAERKIYIPSERILKTMQKDLRLKSKPIHIECFDNSNIQGANPVAACVVFRNLKPAKKDYRHYNIKTVVGPDDFASMTEVVFRRYNRLLNENKDLPQLIIIDGGKGQLNAAVKSLENLGLRGKIAIIGIAKRLEEIYFPDDPVPIYLDKNSESLKIIQQLRNEAHRFGITFHRQKRSGDMIHSSLENIPQIGGKTVEKLIKKLKTVDRIKKAGFEELSDIIGSKKAQVILSYFDSQNK